MLFRIYVLLASTVFLLISSNVFAQCEKDNDCKGERICVKGECVNPSKPSSEDQLPNVTNDTLPTVSSTSTTPIQLTTTNPPVETGSQNTSPGADEKSDRKVPGKLQPSNSQCGSDSFFIDFQCINAHTLSTAGNALFALTEVFYTPIMLAGGISSIVGARMNGTREIKYGILLPQAVGGDLLSFANMAPLAKQRRYLNQLGVIEGKKLYLASWIISSLSLGTTGLMLISWEKTENDYYDSEGVFDNFGFPTTMGVVNVAAVVSTWVVHLITYIKQKQLLVSAAGSIASNRFDTDHVIIHPYFSASPRGEAVIGLAFSW